MADSTTKLVSILVFLILISEVYGECSSSGIHVTQFLPGPKVRGKPEWFVTVTSTCSCAQSVTLNCTGFQSVEPIDPSILKISGDDCLVKGGGRIDTTPIKFQYAWDQPFELNPTNAESC